MYIDVPHATGKAPESARVYCNEANCWRRRESAHIWRRAHSGSSSVVRVDAVWTAPRQSDPRRAGPTQTLEAPRHALVADPDALPPARRPRSPPASLDRLELEPPRSLRSRLF